MKKLMAVFTVLMVLVASSAWAATSAAFPPALNATYTAPASQGGTYTLVRQTPRFFTGFMANASTSNFADADANSTFVFVNSSKVVLTDTKVAKGFGNSSLSGSFGFFNQTNTVAGAGYVSWQNNGTTAALLGNATSLRVNQNYDVVRGLTYLGMVNGTAVGDDTTHLEVVRMIPTASSALLVGLGNETARATLASVHPGSTFMMSYVNGTFETPVYSSDEWDLYATGYDYDAQKGYYIIGKVKMTEALGTSTTYNAQAMFVKYGADNTVMLNRADKWYNYNATAMAGDYGRFELVGTGASTPLIEVATLNKDRNLATGSIYKDASQPMRHFAVMIRNGKTMSTSDLKGRSLKFVSAGYGAGKYLNNATDTLTALSLDNDLNVRDGVMVRHTGGSNVGGTEGIVSLDNYSVALADTNQFKDLTQSNMTITATDGSTLAGNLYVRQTADKDYAVGIYQPAYGARNGAQLVVMVPDSAIVGNPVFAGTSFQSNASFEQTTAGAAAPFNFLYNSTTEFLTAAEMKAQWTSLPSDFTPITGLIGFNATNPGGAPQGSVTKGNTVYATFQVPFTGVGYKVSELALYKVFPTSAKTVRSLSYAGKDVSTGKTTDGAWWISQLANGGALAADSDLEPNQDYFLNYVIEDGGDYDYRTGEKREFGDPIILGAKPVSSSSSSGCVFNPAAGFGLEWLLSLIHI